MRIEYCGKVGTRVGERHWRATERCFNNDFDSSDMPEDMEEGVILPSAFGKKELDKCSA